MHVLRPRQPKVKWCGWIWGHKDLSGTKLWIIFKSLPSQPVYLLVKKNCPRTLYSGPPNLMPSLTAGKLFGSHPMTPIARLGLTHVRSGKNSLPLLM